MPSARQDRRLPGLLLGLGTLIYAGCSPSEIDVVVDVTGLPQSALVLRISASVNGVSGPQNLELTPAPNRFVLRLPNDSAHQGELSLDVTALGVANCVAGTTQHHVTVNGAEATVSTTVPLPRNQLWPCPSPTGITQNALWGSAPDDVYAVGDAGTILHFDGKSWTQSFSPVAGKALYGVGGTEKNHAFAAGQDGTVIRFDGMAWRVATGLSPTARITGLGCSSTGRIYIGSVENPPGAGLHLSDDNAGSWNRVEPTINNTYNAGINFSDTEGWAVGDGGRVRRFRSITPSPVDLPLPDTLPSYAIWGSAAPDVWVVGAQGRIAHRNGNAWEIATVPPTARTVTLRSISGNGPSNILCVGDVGRVLHWDGTTWQQLDSGTTKNLSAVFMNKNGTAWITGEGDLTAGSTVLLHYDPN